MKMKEHFYAEADFVGGSPVFWIVAAAFFLLVVVFFIRQFAFIPVDTETVTGFVLDESKDKASGYKKYFPKPYSVKDLARGDA